MTQPATAPRDRDSPVAPRPRIGEQLIDRGLLTADQLRIALAEQRRLRQPLGRLVVGLGFVAEADLRDLISARRGRRTADLDRTVPDAAALACVPEHLARRHRMLPIAYDGAARRLTLAVADADDLPALDRVLAGLAPGTSVDLVVAGEAEIERAIDRAWTRPPPIDALLDEIDAEAAGGRHGDAVVRLVDALLDDAVRHEASDIHFEPEAGFLRVRCRIDGLLRQTRAIHRTLWPPMAVRLKVLAGMNIAESRAPQDGRFSTTVAGRPVDFRISTQPTLHGENLVLRILDRDKGIVSLDRLGLGADHLAILERLVARPEGLLVVAGPTGSGKTTTLYSLLAHLDSEAVNIMTLEDPVEYPFPRLRQTSVGDAAKVDFAAGVRALLRQDPDVILIGEVRDAETAAMALRAAMTGHQVFTTLHANSALGALPRLADLGVPGERIAGNLTGVIAQRLVRRICPDCRSPAPLPPEARTLEMASAWTGAGCGRCGGTGYRGRLAIMEILAIDTALDDLIAARAPAAEIRAAARRQGFVPLFDDGLRQVREGRTTLAEILRVAGPAPR